MVDRVGGDGGDRHRARLGDRREALTERNGSTYRCNGSYGTAALPSGDESSGARCDPHRMCNPARTSPRRSPAADRAGSAQSNASRCGNARSPRCSTSATCRRCSTKRLVTSARNSATISPSVTYGTTAIVTVSPEGLVRVEVGARTLYVGRRDESRHPESPEPADARRL